MTFLIFSTELNSIHKFFPKCKYLNIVFLTSLFAFITGDQQTGHHTLRYSIYVIVIYYVDLMRSCTLTNLKATCILLPNQI